MTDSINQSSKFGSPEPVGEPEFFDVGHMIGGKYKVVSVLGSGGMGSVYLVQQVFLRREFALKTMHRRAVTNATLQRFQLEAKAASSLNHPNLVHVHDFGLLDDGEPYLVMDYVDGLSFAEYLSENGPLPPELVASFFVPACLGLLAAHQQGVVHRDIKPGNIMVVTGLPTHAAGSMNDRNIKVVDFGIAKQTGTDAGQIQALTRTGEIFGSPLYMSPEQCTTGAVDNRSDIYSLGCVLFEMLTGTPPYMGQSAVATMILHETGKIPTLKEGSLGKEFPVGLESVVAKMLRKSPGERYQDLGLVAHDLAKLSKGADLVSELPSNRTQRTDRSDRIKGTKGTNRSDRIAHSRVKEKSSPGVTATPVSMPAGRFYLMLMLTALLPAALAGVGGYTFRPSQPSSLAPDSDTSTTDSDTQKTQNIQNNQNIQNKGNVTSGTNATNAAVSKRATDSELDMNQPIVERIHASTVTHDGIKQRMFVFPRVGFGEMYDYNTIDPASPCVGGHPAKGIVYVPIGKDVSIEIKDLDSLPILRTPDLFTIKERQFRSLVISNARKVTRDLTSSFLVPDSTSKDDFSYLVEILKNIAVWPNLDALCLKQFTFVAGSFDPLNKLPLKFLRLDQCTFESTELAKQPFLTRLKYLSISQIGADGDRIMHSLAQSTALQTLRLSVNGSSVSYNGLAELRHCPSLTSLQLTMRKRAVSDDLPRGLAQFKSVQDLYIQDCYLNLKQVELLLANPSFTQIRLSKDSYVSSITRELLEKRDSRIKFMD